MSVMRKQIALLPGDGIGPEIIEEARKVLDAVAENYGHTFSYHYADIGAVAIQKHEEPLPASTVEICRKADAVLLGAVGDPKFDNDPKATVRPEQGLLAIRKALGLYCNIRPLLAYKPLFSKAPLKNQLLEGVDVLIFRELTGGIYFGKKGRRKEGKEAYDHCVYSVEEIERIAHQAFLAAQNRRKKLCLVDKANVLESSRLWREVVGEIHQNHYSEIALTHLFVDNAAMQLVLNPSQFDVILTENMFGDILSDIGSVISGSLGVLPSASTGEKNALFEPVHGSYPQAAGKNIANPIAMILSAAMMLDYFGLLEESEAVRKAVALAIERDMVTEDLNPNKALKTSQVGDFVANCIEYNCTSNAVS